MINIIYIIITKESESIFYDETEMIIANLIEQNGKT